MLNNWKQWLDSTRGQRSSRRHRHHAKFRGQLEQLEIRSVLSASIGPPSADFELPDPPAYVAYTAVIWETGWADSAWEAPRMISERLPPRWDSASPVALHGPTDLFTRLDGQDRGLSMHAFQDLTLQRHLIAVVTYVFPAINLNAPAPPTNETLGSNLEPVRGKSPYLASDLVQSVQSQTGQLRDDVQQSKPLDNQSQPLRSTLPAASAPRTANFFLPSLTESSGATYTTPRSVAARDEVLREFSFDSLLLTADVDRLEEDSSDRLDDELLDADKATGERLDSGDFAVAENVVVSLDALNRQREAVEATMAQLRDVRGESTDTTYDAKQTDRGQTTIAEHEFDDFFFSAEQTNQSPIAATSATGGMVLLATSGDANESAYDLSAVVLDSIADDTRAPAGIEVSLGLYQAFDVGGGTLPAANAPRNVSFTNDAAPTGQNAPALRAGISTESAPASKSQQPT